MSIRVCIYRGRDTHKHFGLGYIEELFQIVVLPEESKINFKKGKLYLHFFKTPYASE